MPAKQVNVVRDGEREKERDWGEEEAERYTCSVILRRLEREREGEAEREREKEGEKEKEREREREAWREGGLNSIPSVAEIVVK